VGGGDANEAMASQNTSPQRLEREKDFQVGEGCSKLDAMVKSKGRERSNGNYLPKRRVKRGSLSPFSVSKESIGRSLRPEINGTEYGIVARPQLKLAGRNTILGRKIFPRRFKGN